MLLYGALIPTDIINQVCINLNIDPEAGKVLIASISDHKAQLANVLDESRIPEAYMNFCDKSGNNALHYVASRGNFALVLKLLKCNERLGNLDFSKKNQIGESAFNSAKRGRHQEILKLLASYSDELVLFNLSFLDIPLPLKKIIASFYYGDDIVYYAK